MISPNECRAALGLSAAQDEDLYVPVPVRSRRARLWAAVKRYLSELGNQAALPG